MERKTREQGLQLGDIEGKLGDLEAIGEEDGERQEKGESEAMEAAEVVTASILVPSSRELGLDSSGMLVIGFIGGLGRISMYSLTYLAMLVLCTRFFR